ncbi:hypothetical protein C8R43DRAFT_854101, partial [Mycena crocata]
GISGHLRQELRELEILDEITRLRYEGSLTRSVTGLYRRRLIRSFYAWRTSYRDPDHFHPSMRWDPSLGPRVPEAIKYPEWKPTVAAGKRKINAAIDSESKEEDSTTPPNKRMKLDLSPFTSTSASTVTRFSTTRIRPIGLIWDSRDYSCGYDATLTILGNLWKDNNQDWGNAFSQL